MLVVDMQAGLLKGKPKHDLQGVVARINSVATKIRRRSGQVFLIQHCGAKGDDFEPQTPDWAFLPELPAAAAAQDFPSKPIRLIVPFPPGGPNDIIARVVGQRMSEITRQPVIIDNRGGQAGVLGTDAVAKSTPDGYTIGIVSASALVINPTMEKVPYDVAKDFAPVTLVTTVPEMLVVAGNVPARDMKELVALAKAQPGKLNFASAGVGGLPHLAGELTKLVRAIRQPFPTLPTDPDERAFALLIIALRARDQAR
jgi:Tripartite tricarboxylate transporter family receptor/Isochorismatase family